MKTINQLANEIKNKPMEDLLFKDGSVIKFAQDYDGKAFAYTNTDVEFHSNKTWLGAGLTYHVGTYPLCSDWDTNYAEFSVNILLKETTNV